MEEFNSSSIQSDITQTSEVPFVSFDASIDTVTASFHAPSFPTPLENEQNSDKTTTIGFAENDLPIRIYNDLGAGTVSLKHSLEQDKLAELCQASDIEDDPVHALVNVNDIDGSTERQQKQGQHIAAAFQQDPHNCSLKQAAVTSFLLKSESSDNIPVQDQILGDRAGKKVNTDIQLSHDIGTHHHAVDPSDASDLLQEIQEENTKRFEFFDATLDAPFNEVDDEATILEMEKLSQEKNTLFSENLGLIAKDSLEFKSLTKLKSRPKRIRTRKSVWSPTPLSDAEIVPEAGHKHIKYTYKCGNCSRTFLEMCKLHNHMLDHGQGGSYHYDHILKTAFLKYDTTCASTQTMLDEMVQEEIAPTKKLTIQPLRNVIKPKPKPIAEKPKPIQQKAKSGKEKLKCVQEEKRNGKTSKGIKITIKTVTEEKIGMELPVKEPIPAPVVKKKRRRPRNTEKSEQSFEKDKVKAKQMNDTAKEKKSSSKTHVKTEADVIAWHGEELNAEQDKDPAETAGDGLQIDMDFQSEGREKQGNNDTSTENTAMFVNSYFKEIENDIASLIDKDQDKEQVKEKTSEVNIPVDLSSEESRQLSNRKRKMSTPRKLHAVGNTVKKTEKSQAKERFACDICPSKFQFYRGLLQHEREEHVNEMKFECEICQEKFMREVTKKRHMITSHGSGKRIPRQKKLKGPTTLRQKPGRKPKLKEPEEKIMCKECGIVMPESKAAVHARLHSDIVITSHGSGKRIPRQKKLKVPTTLRQKPGRKPKLKEPEEKIMCKECGIVMPESKAAVHARLHSGERPFICHVCGKGLISDKKLKRHLLIHSEVKRHTCEVCGQGFSMKYKLKTHMYIHTGHKPNLCCVCGAEFNNSTSLLHHNRTVHLGDKRFECTICGGKYGKKSQLEEHMFSHSTEKTQTCRFCGKSFKHAKSLRRHEATHGTTESFKCDQCNSTFSRKDNLERHKMCHLDVTLQCRFCKKKFTDRKRREDHEQFHINQKRLQCQICKEKFLDETYFYNHMEKQHDMTRDMVPDINTIPLSLKDANVDTEIESGFESDYSPSKMKPTGSMHLGQHAVGAHCDTLNISMNVAGIIPSSTQNMAIQGMQSLLVTQNNTANQMFNNPQNAINLNMNSSRILNQPINPGFVIPGMQDGQRTIMNVINAGDNSAMSADQLMIHEQQRLMQEALGTTLNMPTPGYRLQNLY